MTRFRRRRVLGVVVVLALVAGALIARTVVASSSAHASSPPNVTTAAFNNMRTDWDPNEPNLSPSDVQSGTFGKIFTAKLDGSIYAQPLVYNGTVIVTTEKAYAYGLNSTTGKIIWQHKFGKPFEASEIGCGDLTPDIGSTSTPVIDPSTGIVYLTTRLQTGTGLTNSHWWLQAVSATTGTEVSGFPVEIQGTPYNSPGVSFNDNYAMQRPGLLLLGGVIYLAFASDCDLTPYRGIVVGVSETTQQITMWSDESGVGTDANSQAGIWQSGGGLVSDGANQILLTTGNGIAPPPAAGDDPPSTLSESVIRLAVGTNGDLTPTDFFSPSNAPTLDQNDEDLGSGGPIALPSQYFGNTAYPDLLVQVGKDGRIFLLNRDDLGGREQGTGGTDDTLETLGPYDGVWGHPAAYGGQGGWVYVLESSGGGYLRALSYGVDGGGVPQLTSAGTSTQSFGYTSGSPIVTSNGTTAGSAVVWVVYSSGSKGKNAQLQAYSAIPTGGNLPLLWSSNIGMASKFSTPTSYDGMIYVGTRAGKLDAFGTISNAPYSVTPVNFGQVPVGGTKTETVTVTAHRALTVTAVSPASGVLGVEGPTGRASGATIQGVQGSTGVSGTEPIGGSLQPFSVSAPKGPVDGRERWHVSLQSDIQSTIRRARGRRGRPEYVCRVPCGLPVGLRHLSGLARVRSAPHFRDFGYGRRRKHPQLHCQQLVGSARDDHGIDRSIRAVRCERDAQVRDGAGAATGVHGKREVQPSVRRTVPLLRHGYGRQRFGDSPDERHRCHRYGTHAREPCGARLRSCESGNVGHPDVQGHRHRNHLLDHHTRCTPCRRVLDRGRNARRNHARPGYSGDPDRDVPTAYHGPVHRRVPLEQQQRPGLDQRRAVWIRGELLAPTSDGLPPRLRQRFCSAIVTRATGRVVRVNQRQISRGDRSHRLVTVDLPCNKTKERFFPDAPSNREPGEATQRRCDIDPVFDPGHRRVLDRARCTLPDEPYQRRPS